MKTRKLRLIAVLLFCVMLLGILVGCAQKPADSASTTTKVTTEPSSGLEPEIKENKTYYENGQLRTHNVYYETGTIKYSVSYYENGSILSEAAWRENGTVEKSLEYYENGNLRSILLFKTDSTEDKRVDFYENGSVKETYIYDQENPISFQYYETGVLKTKSEYFLDIEAGYKYTEKEYTRYNENGKKSYTDSYYTDTAKKKESIWYHSDGETISSRTTYYNLPGEGHVDEYFEYDENGVLTFYRDYDEKGNTVEEYKRSK